MADHKFQFQKCKLKVKMWESEFKKSNSRPPSKEDIKAAPQNIKDCYKLYWNLKIKQLENQYLDLEPVKDNHESQHEQKTAVKDVDDPILDLNHKEEEKNTAEDSKIEENVWGAHLNKKTEDKVEEKKQNKLLQTKSFQISNKLFAGKSFKMRNPRKSFTRSKSSIDTPNDSFNESMTHFDSELSLLSTSDVNEANFSVEDDCSPKVKQLITSKIDLSPFLKKNFITQVSEEKSSCISLLSNETGLRKLKSARKLDVGWLERVNEANTLQNITLSSPDSGFDSSCGSFNVLPVVQNCEVSDQKTADDFDDDEDVIGDSDTESCQPVVPVIKKRKLHEITNTPQANEISCEQVFKRSKFQDKNEQIYEFSTKDNSDSKSFVKKLTKKDILEKKLANGTVNDNFVKINIKKKVFVRGKKHFNYSKYKKQKWKNRMKGDGAEGDAGTGGLVKCYKCGDVGHYAKYCRSIVGDKMFPKQNEGEEEEDVLEFPTLEEAAMMAQNVGVGMPKIPEAENAIEDPNQTYITDDTRSCLTARPVYELTANGDVIQTPEEVYKVLEKFGHKSFRPGQEEAVMRILSGQSTLVTLSTGSGKSLCYQLPSYMYANKYGSLTLVVSPLVSLMEDQVSSSMSFYKVACLHTNQTDKQREAVMNEVKSGCLHALLVSPETIVIGEKSSGFNSLLKLLPNISFACIDEAHCLSQWSHNFRSSYLLVCQILKEKLGINTFLGLTATASEPTIESVKQHLGMRSTCGEGVIKDTPLPDNLILSVSTDNNKDKSLLQLLQTEPFSQSTSTLIYCTRRDECARLAVLIRTVLRDFNKLEPMSGKRLSSHAEAYHAGMSSARRKQVQKSFMSGNLKIVVATVAFGMGINKADIRTVIHYNMPKNFESYVQEVGRAGRDGLPARCHLFLDSKGSDLCELKRHIYSDSVDRHVVRKLLQRVFVKCDCVDVCRSHEVSFELTNTIQTLDLPEENILTLLYYLELHEDKLIKVLPPTYMNCKITSYRGNNVLKVMSKNCPPLAMALALYKPENSTLSFNVIELADKMKWPSGKVKKWLKNLEWKKENEKWRKTGIVVELSLLGLHTRSRCLLSSGELDRALENLYTRVENQEKQALDNLNKLFGALRSVSKNSFVECLGCDSMTSDRLKQLVRSYFKDGSLDLTLSDHVQVDDFNEEDVISDVRSLINNYRDNNFNGRAVARILHGIQSPNYPASVWYKCKLWRSHVNKNFNKLSRIATKEILKLR